MGDDQALGQVGSLTEEQNQKLELVRYAITNWQGASSGANRFQFRTAIDDILSPEFDDYFLLRWLRARQFDVVAAELMLRRVSYPLRA